MFIRKPTESRIRKYFMEDIDELLAAYKPGEPAMKPDVIKQTLEIEAQRNKMEAEMRERHSSSFPTTFFSSLYSSITTAIS
jgi:hypothetical protein